MRAFLERILTIIIHQYKKNQSLADNYSLARVEILIYHLEQVL
jgi:hypothetical protein